MCKCYDEDDYDPMDDTFGGTPIDMEDVDDIQETGYDGDGI